MKGNKNYLFLIGLTIVLSSCFMDLNQRRQEIYGPYYIANDPSSDCKTLVYEINNILDAERINCVEKAGQINDYIIVETGGKFQYLKISEDKPSDLGDPEVKNNISRPLNKAEFQKFLDSLKIKKFEFSYER